MELNLSSEANAKYALLGLAKEIGSEYSINMEARNVNPKANFKGPTSNDNYGTMLQTHKPNTNLTRSS